MSSSNKGHRTHPISFLFKEPITVGFCMRHWLKSTYSSLVHGTCSLGELLLVAIPKQLTEDVSLLRNRTCCHSWAKHAFSLEHNHGTHKIWYQGSVPLFLHHGKLRSVLKTMPFLIQTKAYSQSANNCILTRRKVLYGILYSSLDMLLIIYKLRSFQAAKLI